MILLKAIGYMFRIFASQNNLESNFPVFPFFPEMFSLPCILVQEDIFKRDKMNAFISFELFCPIYSIAYIISSHIDRLEGYEL